MFAIHRLLHDIMYVIGKVTQSQDRNASKKMPVYEFKKMYWLRECNTQIHYPLLLLYHLVAAVTQMSKSSQSEDRDRKILVLNDLLKPVILISCRSSR